MDDTKYAFLGDVKEKIPELREKYALGIISSLHGHTKEGLVLFKIALDMVPERPEECLFIDDSGGNLDSAMAMGMKVALLDRKKNEKKSKYRIIHELRQIEEL